MHAHEYPYHIAVEVIFHDLDAMGHVNNVVYLVYMETVRVKFIHTELGAKAGQPPLPMVVAEAACTYHAPAFMGELLTVGVGISRIGMKSFDLLYRIDAPDRLVTTGRTVQVAYDYEASQTVPIPDAFKTLVRSYQGNWQPPGQETIE